MMKGIAKMIILSMAVACLTAGCSDGTSQPAVEPDVVVSGTPVTKADLIAALWSDADDVSQDARCLVGSTFEITSVTPFTIALNENPADASESDVIIVSPVSIAFDDAAVDSRGADCGEGVLNYEVQASEDIPLDIEVADELKSRHSLIHMISGKEGDYPDCTIKAHFDKAGREICDEDDSLDIIDIGGIREIIAIRKPIYDLKIKAQGLSDDGVPCGSEEIQSVKLVVDDHSCRLQSATQDDTE